MSVPIQAIAPREQEHELKRVDSKASVQANEYPEQPEVTSIFSELNRKQTARKYWKVHSCCVSCCALADGQAVLFCMTAGLAACMDGFQTKIPGSIIANRGFINQFGA